MKLRSRVVVWVILGAVCLLGGGALWSGLGASPAADTAAPPAPVTPRAVSTQAPSASAPAAQASTSAVPAPPGPAASPVPAGDGESTSASASAAEGLDENDPIEPEKPQTAAWRHEKLVRITELLDRDVVRLEHERQAARARGDEAEARRLAVQVARHLARLGSLREETAAVAESARKEEQAR